MKKRKTHCIKDSIPCLLNNRIQKMTDDNKKKSIKGGNIMLTLGKTLMILEARQRIHYLTFQHVRINRFLKALVTDKENLPSRGKISLSDERAERSSILSNFK